MRKVIDLQMRLGEKDIGTIEFDPKSRDDIPQILRGLQHIYTESEAREQIFGILEELLPKRVGGKKGKADPNNGRPGMAQWKILVLGVLRLALNMDYDRLQELANQHNTIRQMLGHSDWMDDTRYELQTLKDNVGLFTPEILDRINQVVVRAGYRALKKSPEEGIDARADSFVVETDVHFPTDINLLLDAVRKTIEIAAKLAKENGLKGWRRRRDYQKHLKRLYRIVQKLKHSTSKDEEKRKKKAKEIQQAYRNYLKLAQSYLDRAEEIRGQVDLSTARNTALLAKLDNYMSHAKRQIDQTDRRAIKGEKIPHAEKVLSIFEPHTEWVVKGKAGVPVELGLRVCVVEDKNRFILHHQVMEKLTDEQIAVAIIQETKARFPALRAVSFDKGFYSPANQVQLAECLELVVLPKKGKLSQADRARETSPEFVCLRRQHSAVESAINALEVHGLDRCPDHGSDGFKRYVALAVVARNIQRLGAVLRQQDADKERRRRGPYKKAA
ncbi:MAG: ISNCY family transposase [Gammaproteobacteria bacterium]|nr:ISNCY family transposase [Gammaproteobacteria bacterium]